MKLQGNTILWILVGIVLIGLFSQARPPVDRAPVRRLPIPISRQRRPGQIKSVNIRGQEILGTMQDGHADLRRGADIISPLTVKNVRIQASPPPQPSFLMSLLISSFPVLLLIGVWIFMRRMQADPVVS